MKVKTICILLAFVVALHNSAGKNHHHKKHSHSKVHNHDNEDKHDVYKRYSSSSNHHMHHHGKRQVNDHEEDSSEHNVQQEKQHGNATKRQIEENSDNQEDTEEPNTLGTGAGSQPSPIPSDLHIDVGKVNIESRTESCNGVLLEPTFIMTAASCVYPNHTSKVPFDNITFSMGSETKPVKKVFHNPHWHLNGERKENFALLELAQPIAHQHQKQLTSMTWSSYALEDLGDTNIATPDNTACTAASKTARDSDEIRHVRDDLITLSCGDKGSIDPGSPIFRLVDGAPKIYGLYLGHCTTGSLDRAVSGSCGARITKQVFLDFCSHAAAENVELTACDSKLLKYTHTEFPTTVFSVGRYDAVHERKEDNRDVLLAYHSSKSKYYQSFVEDMEVVQRLKTVHDKFSIAVIDVDVLPYTVKAIPFIEYRTKSSDEYFPYNAIYETTKFRRFMDVFGKNGAPPTEDLAFLANLHLDKRFDVPGTTRQLPPTPPAERSTPVVQTDAGDTLTAVWTTLLDSHAECNTDGYWMAQDELCVCLPTHFGDGAAGSTNCQEFLPASGGVLRTKCSFTVNDDQKDYDTLKTEAAATTWCGSVKKIAVTVSTPLTIGTKVLTAQVCADHISDLIACPKPPPEEDSTQDQDAQGQSQDAQGPNFLDESANFTHHDGVWKRSNAPVNTKSDAGAPAAYLDNFEGRVPPEPMTHAPNTHYFAVSGSSANPYSSLFDGTRGIPVLVAYKLTNENMQAESAAKTWLRNKWDSACPTRKGTDAIYVGRGNQTSPEAVKEGQLNPAMMHSYNDNSMDLTFSHLNAFPQYSEFADNLWRKYQEKIKDYARNRCQTHHASATFYVISGLSDYELNGRGTSAFLTPATYWPVAYEGAVPQPNGSPTLENGVTKSIIKPKSIWTVGCCTWTAGEETRAESVSIWANNKPKGVSKHEVQPDLSSLGQALFPGKPCFHFFPANPQCNIAANHFRMEV